MKLPTYIDEPLMIAQEVARRVAIAINYAREIRRQLLLDRNQPKTQTKNLC